MQSVIRAAQILTLAPALVAPALAAPPVGLYAVSVNDDLIASIGLSGPTATDTALLTGETAGRPEIEYHRGFFYLSRANAGGGENTQLQVIDADSGGLVNTIILDLPPNQSLTAMEFIEGELYAALSASGAQTSPSELARIDLASGEPTFLGSIGIGAPTVGIAYDGREAFCIPGGGAPAVLYSLNLADASVKNQGQLSTSVNPTLNLTGMEIGADGVFYYIGQPNNFPNRLYRSITGGTLLSDLGQLPGPLLSGLTSVGRELIAIDAGRDYVSNVSTEPLGYVGPTGGLGAGFTSSTDIAMGPNFLAVTESSPNETLHQLDPVSRNDLGDLTLTFPSDLNVVTAIEFIGPTPFVGLSVEGVGDRGVLAQVSINNGAIFPVNSGINDLGSAIGGLAWDGSRLLAVNSGVGGPATLYQVNPATGAFTEIAPVVADGTPVALTGLTFAPDGTLYGLGQNQDGSTTSFRNRLLVIDPDTGAATDLGEINGSERASGISARTPFRAKGVANGSFENQSADEWVGFDNTGGSPGFGVVPQGFSLGSNPVSFPVDPTDGAYAIINGFGGSAGTTLLTQRVFVSRPSLTFDWRAAWDMTAGPNPSTQPRHAEVVLRSPDTNAELLRELIVEAPANSANDTGAQSSVIDATPWLGATVVLEFEWTIPESDTGPAQFRLDNICLEAGAAPACVADLTTTGATIPGLPGFGEPDGVANLDDLGYYLNFWLTTDPVADLTTTGATIPGLAGFGVPDGTVNLDDLGYFLNFWLAGCP